MSVCMLLHSKITEVIMFKIGTWVVLLYLVEEWAYLYSEFLTRLLICAMFTNSMYDIPGTDFF